MAPKKKGGRRGGKDDDWSDDDASSATSPAATPAAAPAAPAAGKKGKGAAASFAALDVDGDAGAADGDSGGKKGGKKQDRKGRKRGDDDDEEDEEAAADAEAESKAKAKAKEASSVEAAAPAPAAAAPKKSKKKGGKKRNDDDDDDDDDDEAGAGSGVVPSLLKGVRRFDGFAAGMMDVEDADAEDGDGGLMALAMSASKKKTKAPKKAKAPAAALRLLADDMEDEDAEADAGDDTQKDAKPATAKPAAAPAPSTSPAPTPAAAAAPAPAPAAAGKKGKKKGGKGAAADDDDDLDAVLAQMGIEAKPAGKGGKGGKGANDAKAATTPATATAETPSAAATPAAAAAPTPSPAAPAAADQEDDGEDAEDGDESKSASKKKRDRKKKKEEVKETKEDPKKKSPGNAIKQLLMAQQEELERRKKLQEEEERRIAEEERRIEEEERLKEEARLRKKEKEKAKLEQKRKEGKILSQTAKQQLEKNQRFLQQLAAQEGKGIIVPGLAASSAASAAPASDDGPQQPKKKVVYAKRKPTAGAKATASAGAETPAAAPTPADDEDAAAMEVDASPAPPSTAPAPIVAPAPVPAAAAASAEPADDWEAADTWEEIGESASSKLASKLAEVLKPVEEDLVASAPIAKAKMPTPTPTPAAAPAKGKATPAAASSASTAAKGKTPSPAPAAAKTPAAAAAAAAAGRASAAAPARGAAAPAAATSAATTAAAAESDAEEESGEDDDDDEDDDEEEEDDDGSDTETDESDEDEDSDEDDEAGQTAAMRDIEHRKEQARLRREQRIKDALATRSKDNLRSPICCILGHVDTGKTKLLDKIRQTNVQENEAGGITQQIGATYFPADVILQKTAVLKEPLDLRVPGLLVIDTPGHESFTNLRSRGSSLCNIAILVVDIMHGLEPQTIESLNMLKERKTPFIVALNKIDRMYGWEAVPDNGVQDSLARQKESTRREFEDRAKQTMVAFAEQGLNAELYYRNNDMRRVVSLVPTSAITGEGIPDLLALLVQLTQKMMADTLMYITELEATVLEVKVIEGQGTTIDVILSNGYLREGDRICLSGLNGPIVTNIRALLTPQPLRELRVKSVYQHHKEVKAALGVKIAAQGLEKAIAGSRLLVIGPDDDEDLIKEEVMSDLADLFANIDKSGRGVWVQASTLGSLEALLNFLKTSKIPVSGINIGPVHKKDVMRASIMLEHQKEYATMLCFDVKVERDAQEMADDLGVRIYTADIIYHLFDAFTAYMKEVRDKRKADQAPQAVFPCVLQIVPGCVFNNRNPIVLGVTVTDGTLRMGTPLCVPGRNFLPIGRVTGIEVNHKSVDSAKKGQDVAVKIELPEYEPAKMVGRHFEVTDDIMSHISRESIDILKETFREDMGKEDWALIVKLKKEFKIQ